MARLVYEFLKQQGYRVFMDVEDLKSGPFNTALFDKIDSATDAVVILTPGSLDRCHEKDDWLRLEVAYAIQKNKNIIPVMTNDFSWPSEPLPVGITALPTFQGIVPSHVLFKESLKKLTSLLISRPKKHLLIKLCVLSLALVILILFAIGSVIAFRGFQNDRDASPPPITSHDVEAMTQRILSIANECMQDPSVVADKRVELQILAAKVAANVRYREDDPGAAAALYRLTAASLLFQPVGNPDREKLRDGLYWLSKLVELSRDVENDNEVTEAVKFFTAFVEGRETRWNAEDAVTHAVSLALLGSQDEDAAEIAKRIVQRPIGSYFHEVKRSP